MWQHIICTFFYTVRKMMYKDEKQTRRRKNKKTKPRSKLDRPNGQHARSESPQASIVTLQTTPMQHADMLSNTTNISQWVDCQQN